MNDICKKLGMLAVVGGSLAAYSASAECYTVTRGPTYDGRWPQNLSLSTDTNVLREYYPSQCSGNYICDIVSYRIQWFNGTWSPDYYPGVNDVDWKTNYDGSQRRVLSYFYDHNHSYTFCN